MNKLKKVLSFLLIVGVIVTLFFGAKIMTATEIKESYQTFQTHLIFGDVEKVDIDETSGKMSYTLEDDDKKYYTNYPESENFKEELLSKGVEIEIHEKSWFSKSLPYASIPIMIFILIMMLGNISPTNSFSVINKDEVKTNFSNVAGLSEIKKELSFISDMMTNQKYIENGARIPKGILLQGPPGNGKTLIARAFAGETGANFIAVNASDFSSQFVGIGSMKIKQLFKTARKFAPCVIFIDEIDGVGSKRMNADTAAGKEMNTIITALLNEMDGFSSTDNIMVLAATNRSDDLDTALIRPGRFDKQLVLTLPDKQDRKELFEYYTKDKKISENVNLDNLATKTYGLSSSEIECLVNEAIIITVQDNRDITTNEDFVKAIMQMAIKGHIKEEPHENEKEREIIAYHEAGHAVMTYFYSDKEVSTITIKPTTSGAGGFTMSEKHNDNNFKTVLDYKNTIKVLYGGRAAEFYLAKNDHSSISNGSANDIKVATQIALECVSIEKGIDYSVFGYHGEKEVMDKAKILLTSVWNDTLASTLTHWNSIEAVAKELLRKETLNAVEFEEIVKNFQISNNKIA